MLKTIPKANVNQRSFQVNKTWEVTNTEYPIISGSFDTNLTSFDSGSATTQEGVYTGPLFKSIKSQYYSDFGNPFTLKGRMDNIGGSDERNIGTTGFVIALPQSKYGERIQPESLILTDLTNDDVYSDDGSSNITSQSPRYTLKSIDLESGEIVISDLDDGDFTGSLWSTPGEPAFDMETGLAKMTFNNDTDSFFIVRIDLNAGTLTTELQLDFGDLDIDEVRFGNIFYSDGLLVFNDTLTEFNEYTMKFNSTKTISELEVLVTSKAGEFNYSQNPTAVEVDVSGSYNFPTSKIFNTRPAGFKKIKVINDIKRREQYSGSIDHTTSGSWDDYFASSSVDPTGSYLSTYISTIGLYDKSGEMIAVAKLPQPIKNLPDYDMNFIVRLDT